MSGVLYGLGLGPGDPDLVTIKAATVLAAIEVIAYVSPLREGVAAASFARAIAAPHLTGEKIEISIPIAMLDDPEPGQRAYDQAALEIAEHLQAGRDVAVLCEGDPLLFGSFMYVLERLKGSAEIITVPGVSALGAAAAAANLPLVSRQQSLALVPGTLPEAEIKSRIEAADAAAVYKVGRNMTKVRRVLEQLGLLEGAFYIERASLPEARVMALADAPDDAPYFSIILTTATEV